ncbi:MAG: DUF192 domain-containing protein [Dictyoglomus sp.]|nr:DUF192 domain-containing protein [Dictyoglomus sp.]MCX7941581.1 DUF192 domain-containing protein [Dictyoglomaceae bacterium]MDW8187800.1 DUF192 domain-containing protein [Dictyoglomus sp.]
MKKTVIFILLFYIFIIFIAKGTNTPQIPNFPKGILKIYQQNKSLEIPIEIADREELHSFGLMFRRNIPWNFGMLFVFKEDVNYGFWMKNTYIPLEIAFIDSNKTIFNIQKMYPCNEKECKIYYSPKPYRYALEVKMGFFKKFGFKEGAKIEYWKK